MKIIELQNINKTYGDRFVLREVNLEIQEGAFVMISGESGVGKSTLLNLIGGLETPMSGRIVVAGKDVNKLNAKERKELYRREMGFIFQGSYLQPQFSILDNIMLPGIFAGVEQKERKRRAEELAQSLGVADCLKSLPKEVSGGQAERACIARALFMNPRIILADEPTSNLDEKNARMVLEILEEARQKMGVTIVLASHSREVKDFATQVVKIVDGKLSSDDI